MGKRLAICQVKMYNSL